MAKSINDLSDRIMLSGFSLRGFAKHIGVADNTLNNLINHNQSPRPKTAKKIANGLNKNVNDIFLLKPLNNLSKGDDSNGQVK